MQTFLCFYFRKRKKIFCGCKDACEIVQTVFCRQLLGWFRASAAQKPIQRPPDFIASDKRICLNNIWWKLKKNHWAVKTLLTVRIMLNHKKLACKFIFLHISAFQRFLPIFSISSSMFRQFDLLSTLFMSLTFRISDKQMHVTCNYKSVHCIYAKSFACAVWKRLWCLQFTYWVFIINIPYILKDKKIMQ